MDKIAKTEKEIEKLLIETTKNIEIDLSEFKPEKKK